MYTYIDALVNAIKEDTIYKNYLAYEKKLHDPKIMNLLSMQKAKHEDYMKYKEYRHDTELKDELLQIKKEVTQNQVIQDYYASYYQLNELLDEVTQIVFKDISHEL